VRFVQLAVKLAVLPFRHRILVHRLMRLTEGLVLVTMFGIEVSVLALMFGVQVLMLSPVLCRFIVRESHRSNPKESRQRNSKECHLQEGCIHISLLTCLTRIDHKGRTVQSRGSKRIKDVSSDFLAE
jgi:hypothetical protein